MRVRALQQGRFADWLIRVGDGTEQTYPDVGEGMIRVPAHMCAVAQSLDPFIAEVLFPGGLYAAGSAILVAKNDTID